jgi:hypothetical protein
MCNCIENTNERLSKMNTVLVDTLTYFPDRTPMIALTTKNLDVSGGRKPVIIYAAYCPFCGEKYNVD